MFGTTYEKFNKDVIATGLEKETIGQTIYAKNSSGEAVGKIVKPGESYTVKTRTRVNVDVRDINENTYKEHDRSLVKPEVGSSTVTFDKEMSLDFLVNEDFDEVKYGEIISDATKSAAYQLDKVIANLATTDPLAKSCYASKALTGFTRPTAVTKSNIKSILNFLIANFKIRMADHSGEVKPLYMFVDDEFRLTLKDALADLLTSNNELVKEGIYERYENIHFVRCEYVPTITEGGKTIKLYRLSTKEAVVFAHSKTSIKEVDYRNPRVHEYVGNSFAGAKIFRPNEIVYVDVPTPVLAIDAE